MLPAKNRLTGEEIRGLGKTRSFRSDCGLIRWAPAAAGPKAAVVVSKSAIRLATGRNRLRRASYGDLRVFWPNIKKDLVVIYHPASANLKFPAKERRQKLEKLFLSAGLIKK